MIYVRWRRGESRRGRVFPAPQPGHPLHATDCVACGGALYSDSGDIVLIAVGPVDEDERERHEAGRWYNAGAVAVHVADVESMTDAELDALCAELVIHDPDRG